MRVKIDHSGCIGAGQCVRVAPEVFAQDEDDGMVILLDETPPPSQRDAVIKAAKLCPARIIDADDEEPLSRED